jgi:DUF4097 and DUF4098 domain-containing protein YvlB
MKKIVFFLLLSSICLAINAQNRSSKAPYLTKSLSGESIKNITAETSGGNITVTAVNSSEARVEVYVSQNGNNQNPLSNDELKSRINEDYDLNISVNDNVLKAIAKSKHSLNWKRYLNFSFKIYVPANVSTDLKTSGGNIILMALSGKQDFETSGGNLELNSLNGKVKGRTSGGNIYLKNCKDDLDLSTSGGNIQAENSSGNITVSTSGGSIKLNNLKGNVEAKTSGGNVEGESITGDLLAHTSGGNISLHGLSCSLKTSTSGGNIDVEIKNPGKYISINNSAGKINLTIPKKTGMDLKLSAMKISTQNLENFSGTNSTKEINGSMNGGGIPVTVDAGSGKINVVFE